ncbi:MAG: hypothetical protein M0Q43_09195 [Methanothrix sp.]|jgi:hypothetical protein|nr:hypothetical protein [Methanothrix sp.]
MIFKKLENRSVPLGKMLLSCCIALGLITVLSAAVAQGKDVCYGAEWDNYASFGFCLPEQVEVVGDTKDEANYTGGREVAASMLLDGNRFELHLLYPCLAPEKELEPAELKPYLEAYDPIMAQVTYNESEQGPALLGQIGNRNLIAYQPNNQTVALVLTDINMSANMMATFLGNLTINVNEGIAPPGNCPDTMDTTDTADTTVAPPTATVQDNPAPSQVTAKKMTPAEKMKADKEKLQKMMEAARNKL